MSDLFLIAHRVRSEPAFDIAVQMECPECAGPDSEPANADWEHQYSCTECDSLGFWWIIPTSGHRAYPADAIALSELIHNPSEASVLGSVLDYPRLIMDDLPDHYHHTSSPATIRTNLLDILAKLPSPPTKPFKRRF